MKTKLVTVLLIFFTTALSAQDSTELDVLNSDDTRTHLIECCDYLLTTPSVYSLKGFYAGLFINEWMSETSEYTFSVHRKFYRVIKSDYELSNRYYASLVKTAIEFGIGDCIDFQSKAIGRFLEYCENPDNKVIIKKKLKKYLNAKQNNKLTELISEI